jgi:hypothetical protein
MLYSIHANNNNPCEGIKEWLPRTTPISGYGPFHHCHLAPLHLDCQLGRLGEMR